jgi:hypothetical protein
MIGFLFDQRAHCVHHRLRLSRSSTAKIKLRVVLYSVIDAATCKVYLKVFFKYQTKGIAMTDTPVASNEQQKPATPATPQQNQTNQPKPADKPSEQQK